MLSVFVLQHHPVGDARGSVSVDAQAPQVSGSARAFDAPDDWLSFMNFQPFLLMKPSVHIKSALAASELKSGTFN